MIEYATCKGWVFSSEEFRRHREQCGCSMCWVSLESEKQRNKEFSRRLYEELISSSIWTLLLKGDRHV